MTHESHVKRIYISDPEGDGSPTSQDVWIDVLRLDNVHVHYSGMKEGDLTNTKYVFHWYDNKGGDKQHENSNKNRGTRKILIKNPDDPNTKIPLWIVRVTGIRSKGGGQPGILKGQTQTLFWRFNNTNPYTGEGGSSKAANRDVKNVTVVNNDLGGLDMSDGKLVPWYKYLAALKKGTKDESQKLYVEIPHRFGIKFSVDVEGSIKRQIVNYKFTHYKKEVENLFKGADASQFSKVGDVPPVRLDPLQIIVNVSWLVTDFLIFGRQGSGSSATPFLICSSNGKDWYKPEIQKSPGGILAYGGGMWMNFGGKGNVAISKDRMKTWTSMGGAGIDHSFLANWLVYGVPEDPGPDGKRKGRFVAFGSTGRDNITWISTNDNGNTWTTDKVIQTGGASDIGYGTSGVGLGFLRFFNGAFYACMSGNNGYGKSLEPTSTASFTTTMWKSTNGTTWDGNNILADLGHITVFDEVGFPDPMYCTPFPNELIYVKADKAKGTQAKYIISGGLIGVGVMSDVWYSISDDPTKFSGANRIGNNFAALQSAYDPRVYPPTVINGPQNANYYRASNPCIHGGSAAAVGSNWAVMLQRWTWSESAAFFTSNLVGACVNPYLNVSGYQEGVLDHYFTGQTKTEDVLFGFPYPDPYNPTAKPQGTNTTQSVVLPGANFTSDGRRLMASNGSVMVWLRSQTETNAKQHGGGGMEIWYSKNGTDWTQATLPVNGLTSFAGDILTGAAPPKPQGQ